MVNLKRVTTKEEFKGQGIASKAILELINILKQNSIDLVYVQTRLDNNAVVHLFDKTNFKLIGTNFHEVEQKNNWVACNKINSLITNEQEIARYCTEKDIPLLGICCGCINMALSTGGSLSFDNYDYLKKEHFSLENMDMHKIKIDKDSKLFNLIDNEEFIVNSIHKCKIDNTGQYDVKGFSNDGIIELLEMKNKGFNIGVQWHPELITEKNEQNLIFKKFIEHMINKK